jgi:hypothetical protein
MIDAASQDACGVRPAVGDLRNVRDMLLDAGDISARRVANALDQILSGTDARLALGLKSRAGQRSAFTTERLTRRDMLIRQIAHCHFPRQSVSDQAREITSIAAAYWRRAARLDIDLDAMPESYVATPREQLFHLARLPAEMPRERTIRAILSKSEHECDLRALTTS